MIKNDSILNKICALIPKGWTVSTNDSEFVFVRKDSIWILNENRFNSTKTTESKSDKQERIKKEGSKGTTILILKYQKRWSYERILVANNMNPSLYTAIGQLPEKYQITNLYDKSQSVRGNVVYTGSTPKEKAQIAKYEKEKKELLSKVTKIPDFNTSNYSLFTYSISGTNDSNHSVYPEDASLELFQILALFCDYAKK